MLHGCGIALSSTILCSDAQIISWIPSSSSVSLAAPFFLPPIWTLAVNTVLLSAACRHSSCTECTIYSTSLERCIPYSFQGTQLTHMPVFLFLCYFLLLFFSGQKHRHLVPSARTYHAPCPVQWSHTSTSQWLLGTSFTLFLILVQVPSKSFVAVLKSSLLQREGAKYKPCVLKAGFCLSPCLTAHALSLRTCRAAAVEEERLFLQDEGRTCRGRGRGRGQEGCSWI